jgi:ADP-ribosylglycohydrolase
MENQRFEHKGLLLGAIIGDICGSIYEFNNRKTTNPAKIDLINPLVSLSSLVNVLMGRDFYYRFTDDSVLTIATAEVLLSKRDYAKTYKAWGNRYTRVSYGWKFRNWLHSNSLVPYNSWGNGSAMRVSPVGWAFATLEETLVEAKRSAEVTHNHPEGIKGAQSVAAAIFLARNGKTKQEIKKYVVSTFGYDLNRTTDQIRPDYKFDETCMGTVPEAIICFLESNDYVHAVQLAISIGGDTDTLACITGGIAEAFYQEIPDELIQFANAKLTNEMKQIIAAFHDHIRLLPTIDLNV